MKPCAPASKDSPTCSFHAQQWLFCAQARFCKHRQEGSEKTSYRAAARRDTKYFCHHIATAKYHGNDHQTGSQGASTTCSSTCWSQRSGFGMACSRDVSCSLHVSSGELKAEGLLELRTVAGSLVECLVRRFQGRPRCACFGALAAARLQELLEAFFYLGQLPEQGALAAEFSSVVETAMVYRLTLLVETMMFAHR